MVVTTHRSREEYAAQNLERQGFTVYYPRIIKRVSHARRTYDTARPLFPSYLFVAHSAVEGSRWRTLLSTFGVRAVIRSGENPSLLTHAFVASLKAREVEGVLRLPEKPFAIGQEVRIQGGAFDGLVGTILELRENQRIVVLMRLLNQQSKVLLTADGLSPV
ncbi:MAG: transcriptional activator RfaH [Hyphomicrobiaceae bacterium]|nr:transcriptional activator RfaH [Hyphomicrobiaceae bacterium]